MSKNAPQHTNTSKEPSIFWKGIFGGVLGSAILLLTMLLLGVNLNMDDSQKTAGARQNLSDFESVIVDTVSKTSDAVVSVENYQLAGTSGTMYGDFFGSDGGINLDKFDAEPQLAGSGSGVVYKIDGDKAYIVTNNHVIENNDSLEVQMADGQKTEASLVGTDKLSDIAVLTIPAKYAKTTLEFANSDDLQVGSLAIAIGSPVGEDFATSVTQGIISGLNRKVSVDTDGDQNPDWDMTLIQTDAAINPGNSGGALVNTQGQLIGINSSKFASTAIEGMGFAIPINDVKNIVSQLEEKGEVERPALGIQMWDLAQVSIESRTNILKLVEDQVDGVIVMRIQSQSAAEAAGLQQYDVITGINDETVTDAMNLKAMLYQYKVGDTIKLKIIREGKEQTIDVKLTDTVQNNNQ
ncbi:S1C family serine protease [Ignavigranum ruoffiae]|uniref:S1C family serine protease n=1 Tax=Ignavigranum ruoffiae TaxID=89093 RepID=UPI0024ADE5F0|nr:trypsin-like peptidase domain-containing protein [Ignavigranum ruoffiae]